MSLEYVVESWTLYALGAVTIITRLGTRLKMVGRAGLKPDDYLMAFGLVVYSVETTMAHLVGRAKGTNFGLTPAERAALTPHEISSRALGTKAFMVGWFTYSGLIYILKICMVFFFKRITFGLDRQNLIWWCFTAVGTTWVAIILTLFLTCRPWSKSFQVVPDPGLMCEIENPVYYIVVLIFNLFTDGLIISVPLPLLVKAQMPLRRKVFLVLMFSAGVFVMLAAILRFVFSLTDSKNSSTPAIWACRETFVAVLVGNGPMILPLFTRRFWNGGHPTTGSYSHSNDASVELSSRKAKRNSTMLDSDSMEHIVENGLALAMVIKTEISYEETSQGFVIDPEGYPMKSGTQNHGNSGVNGNLYNGHI